MKQSALSFHCNPDIVAGDCKVFMGTLAADSNIRGPCHGSFSFRIIRWVRFNNLLSPRFGLFFNQVRKTEPNGKTTQQSSYMTRIVSTGLVLKNQNSRLL